MQRCLACTRAQADRSKHQIAETVESEDRRTQEKEEQRERTDDGQRRALAALQRQALRRQFAEHDMQRRDYDEGNRDGERV